MKLQADKCAICSSEITLLESNNSRICSYCDTSSVVKKAIEHQIKTISLDANNLFFSINSSIENNKLEQAVSTINQLLEIDPKNPYTWILKGKVAFLKITNDMTRAPSDPDGSDDSVLSIDLHTILNEGFTTAIKLAEGNSEIRSTIGFELHNAIKNCSRAIIDAKETNFFYGTTKYENATKERKLHWLKLLKQSIEIEKKAEEFKESFDIAYNVKYILAMVEGTWVPGSTNYKLSKKLDEWNSNLQSKYAIEYEKRAEKSKIEGKRSECFLASAAMGDYNHPIVKDLRLFRDNWLMKRNWGINFIGWYHSYSPRAAQLIAKSSFLRTITFILVIKPLHLITKIVQR